MEFPAICKTVVISIQLLWSTAFLFIFI
jgi:hypothetical protein